MVSFIIHNVKACSINNGYYKTRKVLTVDGRRYRKRLLLTMNQNKEIKEQLKNFRDAFNPEIHAIKVTYYFLMPRKTIYVKGQGAMSRLGGDVDNLMKLTTDFLFNPKYMGHEFPNTSHPEIENFGVDDQFIASIKAMKLPSGHLFPSIGIKVKIVNKEPKSFPSFLTEETYK